MTRVEHVLAPLDGSERAEIALRWLHLLPARKLTLLRVCDTDPQAPDEAERYLADVAKRLCPSDCAVDSRVVNGCPADAIVDAAAAADLVVMCTRGAGGGGRLLFGSVADRVARHSPTPTLLLRGGSAPVSDAVLRRVVVPLDGSTAAERALPLAVALATMIDCDIHLVTIDESEGEAGASVSMAAYLERSAAQLRADGATASTENRAGPPAEQLLALVTPGDLLVITTHGRGAARRWQIGSVAEKLLRQATAPVVLVRADSP